MPSTPVSSIAPPWKAEGLALDHESGKTGHIPNCLPHSGKQALNLAWAAVEVTLVVRVQRSWPLWNEHEVSGSTTCLLW